MNDAGNVTKDGQQDVDEEVSTAAALEEDTKRREDDGDDDLDDVAEKGSARVVACVPWIRLAGRSLQKEREKGRVDSRSGERHIGGIGLKVLKLLLGWL